MRLLLFFLLSFSFTALRSQSIEWTKPIDPVFSNVREFSAHTDGTLYLAGATTSAFSGNDYLACMDSSATLRWIRVFESSAAIKPVIYAIDINQSGNAVAVGSFTDSLKIGSNTWFGTANSSGFMIEFDSSGVVVSSYIIGGSGKSEIRGIDFDQYDRAYLTGYIMDSVELSGQQYYSYIKASFVLKLEADSVMAFKYATYSYGSPNWTTGEHIAVNENGEIYLRISGHGHVKFDSLDVYGGASGSQPYSVIFDSTCTATLLWLPAGEPAISKMSHRSSTYFYSACVGGWYWAAATVRRVDASGAASSLSSLGYSSWAKAVDLSTSEDIFSVGSYHLYPAPITHNPKMYLKKADSALADQWTLFIESTNYVHGVEVKTVPGGIVYAIGYFNGELLIPNTMGVSTGNKYFICRIRDVAPIVTKTDELITALLEIYPNPSTGLFQINSERHYDGQVCIYDLLGNCIFMQQINNENNITLDLSDKAKGVYFIELRNKNTRINSKIIIN